MNLISTLPKNHTPCMDMVISAFLKYPKRLLHLFLNVIKVPKPKGNCDYHAVAMATVIRSFSPQKHIFFYF